MDTSSDEPRRPVAKLIRLPDADHGARDTTAEQPSDQILDRPVANCPADEDNDSLTATESIAGLLDRDILRTMTAPSLTAKHQASTLVANLRGRHARVALTAPHRAHVQLADILPRVSPAPKLELPPTTRAIGPGGRIRITVRGRSLTELLGWQPGTLTTSLDGAWVVLRPDHSGRTARRHDGSATFTPGERVRLSSALCAWLELHDGDEVALVVVPDHGALALCNPNRLLLAAPLSLLATAGAR
jgi:hypothetical protein